ncbi:hypothetical protein D9M68_524710 [compost metagenome]
MLIELIEVGKGNILLPAGICPFPHQWHFYTGFIINAKDIKFKILPADLVSVNVINIFHHQIPGRQVSLHRLILQQFSIQHFGGCLIEGHIGAKFAYLVFHAIRRIPIGYGQYLIRIKRAVQRNIT